MSAPGGVVATIAIDVATAAVMPFMGLPATEGFFIIGDTAAEFSALIGLQVTADVLPSEVAACRLGLVGR